MAFSNYLAGEILDDVFSGNAFTPPGTFYLALYTSAPTASGAVQSFQGTAMRGKRLHLRPPRSRAQIRLL